MLRLCAFFQRAFLFNTNEKVMSIYKKIAEVKKEVGKVSKNAKNPHFKNTYADLNALIDAVEPIILEKGLVMLQPLRDGKVTTIIHDVESNESIESSIDLPALQDPQKIGSAITYFRRYTLQSLLSLMAEDDDGNGASKPPTTNVPAGKQILNATEATKHIALKTPVAEMQKLFEMTEAQIEKYKSQIQ